MLDEWKSKEGIDNIELVKFDVQGAELNVLRGMKSTLESQHPALLIEVHPQGLKNFGFSAPDIIALLTELDYRIEPVDKRKIDFSRGDLTLFCH